MDLPSAEFQVNLRFQTGSTTVETVQSLTAELIIDKIILNGGGGNGGPTILSSDPGQILEQRDDGLYGGMKLSSNDW